ncbi:MAG: hypothetical protein VB009_01830 [Erysipelotrichaceae bacterium]|nr:hypothetical protein [Erysipelotrichaceae bacterium]
MKRVFGLVEAIFNILYLGGATTIAYYIFLLSNNRVSQLLVVMMAMILVIGDSFHLVPRIIVILTKEEERWRKALGIGKLITSITMTIFYLILTYIGILLFEPENPFLWLFVSYLLVIMRIILCLMPQNKWIERYPPLSWSIARNIPFFIQGMIVSLLFFSYRDSISQLRLLWLAITLSFIFYLPVVLWANKNPKVGMLMLPKTCIYVWILTMFLTI